MQNQNQIVAVEGYVITSYSIHYTKLYDNCDKVTPGMLMAAMRLNIPAIFVSGGPMEAGKARIEGKNLHIDLVDAMVAAATPGISEDALGEYERSACPTCGSCSGMFTANSMNCLTEALRNNFV